MTTVQILMLIGRMVFGGFFLIAGIRNFLHFGERIKAPTNYGWPLPAPLVAIGFAIQLVGGIALILNLWTVVAVAADRLPYPGDVALPQPLHVPG